MTGFVVQGHMFYFSQILFQFIPPLPSFTFFFDSALVVKFTISSQKACLINMKSQSLYNWATNY